MITALALSLSLGLAPPDDTVVHQGAGFTLQYPEKNVRLQPPSARVPFQLEYRKHTLVRLETERLTQPIDLSDPGFAQIFLEVQLERLKERVATPLESQTVRGYPWGTGIEFVYFMPARSGKRNERDRVTEVVTTAGETLYRFTTWMPEKEIRKHGAVVASLVASFRPERPVASTAPVTSAPVGARFSIAALEDKIRENRNRVESAGSETPEIAEAIGLKAYLSGEITPTELEDLRRAAEAAATLAPSDVDSRKATAWAAYHQNEMVDMEKAIQEALAIDGEDAEAHLLHALWYGFHPQRSEEMAKKAVEADPEYAPAHYVKALADRRAGDLLEARQSLERALHIDPGFRRARQELAELLEEAGDVEGALTAYRTLSLESPEDFGIHFRVAVNARRAGLIDEAISEYETALRLNSNLPEAHHNLAVLYLQEKGSPELAAQSFRRFLELDPESERAATVRKWLRENRY